MDCVLLMRETHPTKMMISRETQWLNSILLMKKSIVKSRVTPVINPVEYFSKDASGLFQIFSMKLDPDHMSKSTNKANLSDVNSGILKMKSRMQIKMTNSLDGASHSLALGVFTVLKVT